MGRTSKSPTSCRYQYGLASLLWFVGAVALAIGVSQTAGYFSGFTATGAGIGIVVLLRQRRSGRVRLYQIPLMVALLIVQWFVLVDRYEASYACFTCRELGAVEEYRIAGFCIYRVETGPPGGLYWHNHGAHRGWCAGQPVPVLKRRYWGLLVCACPCDRTAGILRLEP